MAFFSIKVEIAEEVWPDASVLTKDFLDGLASQLAADLGLNQGDDPVDVRVIQVALGNSTAPDVLITVSNRPSYYGNEVGVNPNLLPKAMYDLVDLLYSIIPHHADVEAYYSPEPNGRYFVYEGDRIL